MSHRWYYQLLMEEFGPVTESAIHELTKDGTLGSIDLVRREDSESWITVAQLPAPANDGTISDGPQDIADLEELSFSFEETASAPRRSTPPLPSSHTPEQSTPPVQVVQSSVKAGVTYYCKSLGQVLGPMTMSDLMGMAESGALSQEDFVRHGEGGPWQIASEVPELAVSIFQHTNSPEIPAAPEVPVRRLFQTAGRPKSTSTHETNDATDNGATDNNATGTAADSGSVAQSETQSESQVEPTGDSPNESKKSKSSSAGDKGEKTASAATKRSKLKRREKSKSDKAEDALLNEIFGEVFADDEKSTHPGMPAAATGPAPKPVSAKTASDSSVESSTSAKTAKGSTARRKASESKSGDLTSAAQTSTTDKQDSASENSAGSVIATGAAAAAVTSEVASFSDAEASPTSDETSATVSAAPEASTAIPASPVMPPSPVMLALTPEAASTPLPASSPPEASTPIAPSKPRRSFSFDGPVRMITLSVVAIATIGGLIMTFGLPSFSFNSAGKHADRMATVAAEFKAAGDTPAMAQWESLCLKSRAEFVPLYKGMLESGASGPANVACMEGMKAIIAIASTKPEETDRRKELLQNLDKALADMKK